MHKNLKEGGKDETARGASLRELQRFFKEHDKDKGYAGLRRIPDEDGTAVWTILNETEVAAQLEKRVNERREEERREEERPSSEATPELERLKAENENQKQQLIDAQLLINAHQNQETEAPPTITEGNVPDMAAELRKDMEAIKAQLSQLDGVKEQLGELKATQQDDVRVINDELSNLRKGFFWIRSPKRNTRL